MKFILATHNKNKVQEIKDFMPEFEFITAYDLNIDLSSFNEEGTTFEENAELKAKYIYKITGMPTIADDSGLCVDILNGRPGIYSSRYSGKGSYENIQKLLSELDGVPAENRTARFVCAISCIISSEIKFVVKGECKGIISNNIIGEHGFGYDPVFIFKNGRTFAQMTKSEKIKYSHRGNALKLLKEELKKYGFKN